MSAQDYYKNQPSYPGQQPPPPGKFSRARQTPDELFMLTALPDASGGYGDQSGVCPRLQVAYFLHFSYVFRVTIPLQTSTRSSTRSSSTRNNPATASLLQGVRLMSRSKPSRIHMTCSIPPTAALWSAATANSNRQGKVRRYGRLYSMVSTLAPR
jgi:hypothetical protein